MRPVFLPALALAHADSGYCSLPGKAFISTPPGLRLSHGSTTSSHVDPNRLHLNPSPGTPPAASGAGARPRHGAGEGLGQDKGALAAHVFLRPDGGVGALHLKRRSARPAGRPRWSPEGTQADAQRALAGAEAKDVESVLVDLHFCTSQGVV